MAPPHVQLRSSVPNGTGVYSQQLLTFTCITTGLLLVWRSDEYLNKNLEELAFTSHSVQRETTFGSVKAVLTNVTNTGSSFKLSSTLTIVVIENYHHFGVSCHGDDSNLVERRSYYLIDGSPVIASVENKEICVNGGMHFSCEVRDSLTMQLSSPVFGGETVNCLHNDSSNYTISINNETAMVHKNYTPHSNGESSILKCSLIIDTEGLPTNKLLFMNCLNQDIGISRNDSFMVSQDFCPVITGAAPEVLTTIADKGSTTKIPGSATNNSSGFLLILILSILVCLIAH